MSSSVRTLLFRPRPLRSLAAARPRRAYASIPTKNPNPTVPLEPSREQAMPLGSFYEAILNTPQPIPDVKPEEPASSVKENLEAQAAEAEPEAPSPKEPARRGRKPKAAAAASSKTEPASTATASSAPTASPAASQKATAKEAAAKSS